MTEILPIPTVPAYGMRAASRSLAQPHPVKGDRPDSGWELRGRRRLRLRRRRRLRPRYPTKRVVSECSFFDRILNEIIPSGLSTLGHNGPSLRGLRKWRKALQKSPAGAGRGGGGGGGLHYQESQTPRKKKRGGRTFNGGGINRCQRRARKNCSAQTEQDEKSQRIYGQKPITLASH